MSAAAMLAHYAGPQPVATPTAAPSLRLPILRRLADGWPPRAQEVL